MKRSRLCFRAVTAAIPIALAAGAFGQSPFPAGVASGDVTESSAVLWTRTAAAGTVRCDVTLESPAQPVVFSADVTSGADADFTAKLVVDGLQPASFYTYRFARLDDGDSAAVGRFRTAPAADASSPFRFVYSGDSNAADRPFRLLDFARQEQPDFWFWAGDTIYADFPGDGLGVASDLAGYRAKHRLNRQDAALQALLAEVPLWVQWDDHEVVNDYDGGEPEPGLTRAQIEAGYRAFFEHMPLRRTDDPADPWRTYRSFRYGRLAEFFLLDCRQYRSADAGRAGGGLDPFAQFLPTLDPAAICRIRDPGRTMLGAGQLAWLKQGLANSTATWKFVLSSVPFSTLLVFPYDRWDGYSAERFELLRFIDEQRIAGVVLVSADIHGNAVNPDVTRHLRTAPYEWRAFSPGFRLPEIITGPIATDTVRGELAELVGGVLGLPPDEASRTPIVDLGYSTLVSRVALANGFSFVDADRFAYLVVDVTADRLTLTHKGIPPDATLANPTLTTLHTATLPSEPGCAPGLPLLMIPMGAWGCGRAGRRQRRS